MYYIKLPIFLACVINLILFDRIPPDTYVANEGDGLVQITLGLSNPSSTDIDVQVNTVDGSATGEY